MTVPCHAAIVCVHVCSLLVQLNWHHPGPPTLNTPSGPLCLRYLPQPTHTAALCVYVSQGSFSAPPFARSLVSYLQIHKRFSPDTWLCISRDDRRQSITKYKWIVNQTELSFNVDRRWWKCFLCILTLLLLMICWDTFHPRWIRFTMHAWQAELRDKNDQYLSGRQGVEIYCATVRRGHQGTPIKLTCSSEFFHPALIIEESIEVSFLSQTAQLKGALMLKNTTVPNKVKWLL